jgi:hypothetical protein
MTHKTCSLMLAAVLSSIGATAVAHAEGTSNTIQIAHDPAAGCTARLTAGVGSTKGSAIGGKIHLDDISMAGDEGPEESIAFAVATAPGRQNVLMTSLGRENSIECLSMRPAIPVVLIGLAQPPVPAVVFQDGDQIRLMAFDGSDFRLVAQQPAPAIRGADTLHEVLESGFAIPGVEIRTCTVLDGGE